MKKSSVRAGLVAVAIAATLICAPNAHARGGGIDPNGIWSSIVAWFTGVEREPEAFGVVIDPNG